MQLVVGLGNPGTKYKNNRHNIGFMAADEIVRRHGLSMPRTKFRGELSEGDIDGEKIFVLKPATFMNESGRSVGEALRFFKLSAENVIVIYDEIDLATAKIRVKQGGGHAGHNGLRSIDSHLDDKNYWRVRLGIGHPGEKSQVSNYVLSNFSEQDREWVEREISAVADELPLLINGQVNDFASRVTMAAQDKPKPTTPKFAAKPETMTTNTQPAPDEAPETALGKALSRAINRSRGRE